MSPIVHLTDYPGAGGLLPVVIPHHAVRVNVARRPRSLADLIIDLGGSHLLELLVKDEAGQPLAQGACCVSYASVRFPTHSIKCHLKIISMSAQVIS